MRVATFVASRLNFDIGTHRAIDARAIPTLNALKGVLIVGILWFGLLGRKGCEY